MNVEIKINAKLAKMFMDIGVIIFLITLVIFIFKDATGYEKVTFFHNYENCSVTTKKESYYRANPSRRRRHGGLHYNYYVTVTNSEHNIDFQCKCTKSYYNKFLAYNKRDDVKLTFYKTEDNVIFPVYEFGCGKKEAEREWREANPPTSWHLFYAIGFFSGFILIGISLKSTFKSKNYADIPPASPPIGKRDLTAEFDRIIAQDKQGKFGKH